ncbi:MAG: NAD(P)H-dependent oxidoreductase [Candidatus Gracilibacteria bacterium]|nr:NAD(P)H-dependent oxidoreductase [Candidatus Gracilibacteria bacterium]
MKKTVVINGHSDYEKSFANKAIINGLVEKFNGQNFGDLIEIRTLIELYPDFKIDVDAEQNALLEADNIVLQFPLYWYSTPAILKQWIDNVLQRGFSHGSNGDKLRNKNLIISITIGSSEINYPKTQDGYDIEELIAPFRRTSNMIQTNLIEPVYSFSMTYIPGVNEKEGVLDRVEKHIQKLYNTLINLQ